ncbi:ethionine resistance protein [Saitoella coloradoensis]
MSTERDPLLPKLPPIDDDANIDHAHGSSEEQLPPGAQKHEFATLTKMSVPVILAYMLQNSLQTGSVLIVGRRSAQDLAVAAFSYMFAMATAWLIGLGGTTALDTLASQAYGSGGDPRRLGILLQRGLIVLTAMYIPIAFLWWNVAPVLRFLHQEVELADDTQRFLRALIPGGLGYIYFEAGKKYLQAQGIMRAGTYILLIASPLNLLSNYFFVYTLKLGLLGAAYATGLTYWLSAALLALYSTFIHGHEAWGGISSRSIREGKWEFFTLAISGVLMVGTEWWAFEIVALVAGSLGAVPLAAQSVIMTTDQILNTVPFGLGVASSTRVGNLLGARRAKGAGLAANISAFTSVFFGGLVMVVMLSVRSSFGRLFSDEQPVIELVAHVLPYVAAFQIADGIAGSQGGCLRGMGRQHVGAVVNSLAYYAFALPLGIWLALRKGYGLEGLWMGQCVALFTVGALEWVYVYSTNWEKEVERAAERYEDEESTSTANQGTAVSEEV